jgi:hypothetical protein
MIETEASSHAITCVFSANALSQQEYSKSAGEMLSPASI